MWLNGRCGPAGPQLWQSQLWEAGGMPRDTSLCSRPREQHHLPGPASAVGSGWGAVTSCPSFSGPPTLRRASLTGTPTHRAQQ